MLSHNRLFVVLKGKNKFFTLFYLVIKKKGLTLKQENRVSIYILTLKIISLIKKEQVQLLI